MQAAEVPAGGQPAPDPAGLLEPAREQLSAGRFSEAEATCRRVLATRPDQAEAHRVLGKVLHARGRGAEAVVSFAEAVRLDPTNPKPRRQLALALAEEGRLPEALGAVRAALELRPDDPKALSLVGRFKRFSPGDPDLAALEALVGDRPLDTNESIIVSFALAKAYEEVGDYRRAFESMRRANELHRSTFEYDVEGDVRFLARIADTFNAELFARFTHAGSDSEIPLLVVGMPRSGTTLVEQILASHPRVHGGGELRHLPEIAVAVSLLNEAGLAFPEGVADLRDDDLRRLGDGYAERLRRLAPGASRVVDKTNWNFKHVGLAWLILPRARVIHCLRNPIDTCLSGYSLHSEYGFGSDLQDLGRFYRAYAELMAHWRAVLPPDAMLEVTYEELVDDFEPQVRRILDYCGLEWDDACLAFHSTNRPVRTASFTQVRRPIYRSAVARWRHYESFLGPLLAELGGVDSGPFARS